MDDTIVHGRKHVEWMMCNCLVIFVSLVKNNMEPVYVRSFNVQYVYVLSHKMLSHHMSQVRVW